VKLFKGADDEEEVDPIEADDPEGTTMDCLPPPPPTVAETANIDWRAAPFPEEKASLGSERTSVKTQAGRADEDWVAENAFAANHEENDREQMKTIERNEADAHQECLGRKRHLPMEGPPLKWKHRNGGPDVTAIA
jgi:hypothetical protein